MRDTLKGIKSDFERLKRRIILWLIKKLRNGRPMKSPVDVLWEMIDEENRITEDSIFGSPDCGKIEAWELAISRIKEECAW